MSAPAKAAVIGAGAWGTALAMVLARQGWQPSLWVYEPELAAAMIRTRQNHLYLPQVSLPAAITPTTSLADALADATLVVVAVPSHALRATLHALPALPPAPLLLATKGLEADTHLRVSQVVAAVLGADGAARAATLSGPTFALEIARGEPAAMVVAAADPQLAARLQAQLSSPELRLYTSSDLIGVELAAALKNTIAIAAGICQGLELGSNTRAALITRGLAEIGRLVAAAGGRRETVAGLAGLGDLVLTCTGELSRNRRLGIALGQGVSLAAYQASTPSVAEGVRTTIAAVALAQAYAIELPITAQMHRVLFAGLPPRAALAGLMQRALKPE